MSIAACLFAAVLGARASAAEELLLYRSPLGIQDVEVERDANLGGYLVASLARSRSYDTVGAVVLQRVERERNRVVVGAPVLVAAEGMIWSPRLSFSQHQGIYLLVYVAPARGRPRVDALFGQLLAADGEPLSAPLRISPEDGCSIGALYGVEFSANTNRWLVAWSGIAVSNRVPDCERVRARFVDATGTPGHEVRISRKEVLRSGGGLGYSAGTAEFLVVWVEGSGSQRVVARRIRELGRNGKRTVLDRSKVECLLLPDAAASSDGAFLVTWVNQCEDETAWSLDSRLLDIDGNPRRRISFRNAIVPLPGEIAFSERIRRFMAVWEEIADPDSPGAERQVVSRTFRRRGRPLSSVRKAGTRGPFESQGFPRLSCSTLRPECLAVWLDEFGFATAGELISLREE